MPGNSPLIHLPIVMLLLSGSFLSAQEASATPAAPVPAQIMSAKKVFISNGGEVSNPVGVSCLRSGTVQGGPQTLSSARGRGARREPPCPPVVGVCFSCNLAPMLVL